jgi:DNA-binding LytR/AlgR family response regulator
MQDFFFVRCDGRYEKVNYDELIFIRSRRNYMQMVTESKTYLVLTRMSIVKNHLPKELFCRIHKSYFVSLNRVKSFDNFTVWLQQPPEGRFLFGLAKINELPLGKYYRKTLRDAVTIVHGMGGRTDKIKKEAAFVLEGEEMEVE